jgi:hypothetical protein
VTSWGGLNPALASWRHGIVARFPRRGTQSDGARADQLHASTSQHQPDRDGTTDAFDCDVNFLGSSDPTGTGAEQRIAEALKADFQADGRAQLWIHDGGIANADVDDWRWRHYLGQNAHRQHIHFESRQAREHDGRPWRFTHTDALLAELAAEEISMDIALTDDARDELGPYYAKRKTLPFATCVNLMMIHSARAAKDAAAARELAEQNAAAIRALRELSE